MASEEKSEMITDEDLEDGEIEDDDEVEEVKEVIDVKKVTNEPSAKTKIVDKSPSPQRKSLDNKKSSSSKKESRSNQDEDDFMSSIESKIANVLKKEGVEPPMPNIKKNDAESEQQQKSSRGSRKRRRRREREQKEKKSRDSATLKKRSKISDSDNLYMIGGSPDRQDHSESDSDSYTSYSSYESDEYHRTSYEERRNKRRDKYGSRGERERERDRERDRDRDRKDRRNREIEKEVCLRFSEFGHCPDEDCTRVHEVRQPKKMELCKFWLMECCAKKEKCSYMHGDFPCKYYYLGLKCINKDCKFMHGKPLSDNLKQILLKHLDTAPKEILGDFPRIGRENASKMISQTHIKLCQEFNIPLPESEKTAAASNKIPSLLDMKLKPPDEFHKNDSRKERGAGSSSSSGTSRWLQKDSPRLSKETTSNSGPGDTLLSEMRGILSDKQIESMAAINVKTVNHINNLTVSQINEIGLSLATIGEIQATAINMFNNTGSNNNNDENKTSEDIDLRGDQKQQQQQQPSLSSSDIDMRLFRDSRKSPDTIMSPNQSDAEVQEIRNETIVVTQTIVPSSSSSSSNNHNDNVLMSPPSSSGIDYSQYLRDSNLNDDENEDEPGLRIDETYASDYEAEDKKDSQSEDDQLMEGHSSKNEASTSNNIPLLPPSFDTIAFLNTPALAKVDISSSIQQQLMERSTTLKSEKTSRINRDPRMAAQKSPTKEKIIAEISSPDKNEMRRTSIYEIESPSEDEDINTKIDKDKDMRMLPFLRDSENGDVDFRFPFTPMANYVPATEIDGSFGTHIFQKYEVEIVDIPKPDYSEIRRNFKQMENTQDPRLKRLCGLQQQSEAEQSKSSNISSSTTVPSDPRKRKQQQDMLKDTDSGPKKLQISTILQNSNHYSELSSSQKMIVNDVLAELSKQLKLFHADPSPKIFDTTFITQRPRLQQILIGLGVFVNADGEFEELKDLPINAAAATQVVNLPNLHQMPPTILPNILQQPPPNLMMQPPPGLLANIRPGLLGIAPPPNLAAFNFDAQDAFGSMNNNQGQAFGSEQNFNRNQRQQQQQQHNNNNFRNNSHRNNYRSNRR